MLAANAKNSERARLRSIRSKVLGKGLFLARDCILIKLPQGPRPLQSPQVFQLGKT